MAHTHKHTHACTCACSNLVVRTLKDRIFSEEHVAKITSSLPQARPAATSPQPIVFTGGTIRPVLNGDAEATVAAIGFADGKVIASGTLADVQAAMDTNYEGQYSTQTLTGGQTLLPGLFEPHIHTVFSGIMAAWVDVSPFEGQNLRQGYTQSWVLQTLQAALKQNPGNTILASGLDPALITPNGCSNFSDIDRNFLDQVSETVSILVFSASGHTFYLNTMALEHTYSFNELDPAFRKQYPTQQDFINDTNGVLEEQAGMEPAALAFSVDILKTTENLMANLDAFFQEANSRGVTSMYDAMIDDTYLPFLLKYVTFNKLSVRLGGARYCESMATAASIGQYKQPAAYSDIYYGHLKIVSDGSNQGLTGYQSQPYNCGDEGDCGIFDFASTDDYQQLIDNIMVEKGWPLMIHANGDKAVSLTIAAFQAALKGNSNPQQRNRIEHCSFLDSDGITEMAALNISPSFLIGHVGYWGDVFNSVIFSGQQQNGQPKINMLDVCQSALNGNLRISLHSDHTVTPVGPLRMMEQSITRIMEALPENTADNVLNAPECLSPAQALKAVTYDAAWQCYADQWAGSLTNGYFADFIVLATDPLTMPADQISMNMRNINVVGTWLGGVQVYSGNS